MARPLVIVESPAKARTIEKFFNRRVKVVASMGHVRDLPKSQLGVDVKNGFQPRYITIRGKGQVVKQLREEAKKAGKVYLATDPDREGEAISWHLTQVLDLDPQSPLRLTFHEVTKPALEKAMKEPRPIDMHLVEAQQARRILDRLVGYELSPLLWRKVRGGLSAGRVQSVAVRLIVEREREIEAFTPEEYWTLEAELQAGDQVFRARYQGEGPEKDRLASEEAALSVVEACRGKTFWVREVKKGQRQRQSPLPFTTSTLQQEASRQLGFTAQRTMRVAQELYEGLSLGSLGHVGLITYMRTDSTRVAQEAMEAAEKEILRRFGGAYVRLRQGGRGAQDAHEAIRPTHVDLDPDAIKEHLTRDQYRLYRLIYLRFLASQMAPARYDTMTVTLEAGETGHLFRASGSRLVFPGFLALYQEGKEDDERDEDEVSLPALEEGQMAELLDFYPEQHFTQPPPRYTEASLIKALEEKGIGRPSTYAPIVETIQKRGYVVKEQKRFYPTELGRLVTELLEEHFPKIVDVDFTARMESLLDQVEEGKVSWKEILEDFYRDFAEDLKKAEAAIEKVHLEEEVTDERCPRCGRPMVVKHGRFGPFLACSGYPECQETKPLLVKTGVACPKCGGEIVERRSRKGRVFYGCSNYPACDFVLWDRPTGETCPVCGSLMVEKRGRGGKVYTVCSNRQCEMSRVPGKGKAPVG
ncbi:MAG: type I DNA topoisomerase [Clostridiales bacterium]|nr:type I DNA topoisomerase [Clostridiales bacterium]